MSSLNSILSNRARGKLSIAPSSKIWSREASSKDLSVP
jgi:hypothetical protein